MRRDTCWWTWFANRRTILHDGKLVIGVEVLNVPQNHKCQTCTNIIQRIVLALRSSKVFACFMSTALPVLAQSEPFPLKPAEARSTNNQQNYRNSYTLPHTILPDELFGMESMNSIPPVNHLCWDFASAICYMQMSRSAAKVFNFTHFENDLF